MPTQEFDFVKWCVALLKRIRAFRKLQLAYMPHVRRFLTASQRALWDMEADRDAEAIWLFMPSDITDAAKRVRACAARLPEIEVELCEGEAHEVLEKLHQGLRIRTMMNRYRLHNATGQCALTRGQGVLHENNVKIDKAKLRYRYAQNTLMQLRGNGEWARQLRVLEDGDVHALNERALTEEEAAQRGTIHDLRDVEEGGVEMMGVVANGRLGAPFLGSGTPQRRGIPRSKSWSKVCKHNLVGNLN
jgi:hypothetical protein